MENEAIVNMNRRMMMLEASQAQTKEDLAVVKEDIQIIKHITYVVVSVSSTTLIGLLIHFLLKV